MSPPVISESLMHVARCRTYGEVLNRGACLAIELSTNAREDDSEREIRGGDLLKDIEYAQFLARALLLRSDFTAISQVLVLARAWDSDCPLPGDVARVLKSLSSRGDGEEKISEVPARLRQSPGNFVRIILALACRMLPIENRSRFAAEFYSELFELPRHRRLGHAIRILRRAPATRASIRSRRVVGRERP